MDRTPGSTAVEQASSAPDFELPGPNDVIDLTDRTGPRIVREAPPAPPRPGRAGSVAAGVGVLVIALAICWHLANRLMDGTLGPVTTTYSLAVSTFVLSRFGFAIVYRPPAWVDHEPTVAIVIPAFNEGAAVARTIDACVALDYPADRLEIVCIDDGSTDDTARHMHDAVERHDGRDVREILLGINQGKRAAMAAGMRATSADIIVFIDSDSHPAPDAVRRLVQGFIDPRVGAISGLTHVRNAATNLLTRMQAVRYYVSFQLLKSAESVVGAVTCCSGCFAAYRRSAVMEVLDGWEGQRFLGVRCTYGDDRALTNMLLRRGWRCRYAGDAEAWTDAPDTYSTFLRQQLRWKKSWARESPLLLAHLWRTRPVAFPFVLVGVVASLASPFVIAYHLTVAASSSPITLVAYLLGLYLISMGYALVYRCMRDDGLWWYALAGTGFYLAISPQLLWAMARIRDGSWGTRG